MTTLPHVPSRMTKRVVRDDPTQLRRWRVASTVVAFVLVALLGLMIWLAQFTGYLPPMRGLPEDWLIP